ncbi:MAG: hypothetical protein A2161_16030 [Candidatus Schekmanbacteria bacterium RBG_13_48_7]|uniref:Uncharacterized protein n=1 Tax=Candidatus Schekmanbacteria bacterium RBG_13_48_7 TaxID=1817878 RepID=A0A1F7RT31_9BACT|nr:MAG: hypothetical protein A2161_16030 [Candidatus Schekmanbacteria bacterium RBG_13_48_7]
MYPGYTCIYSIWGTSSSDVFVTNYYVNVIHYDGISWLVSYEQPGINSIWGTSSSDVFAVGDLGTIIH